jgi:hypothetical protein
MLQGRMGCSEIGLMTLLMLLLDRNTVVVGRRKLWRWGIVTTHLMRHWEGVVVAGIARWTGLLVVVCRE